MNAKNENETVSGYVASIGWVFSALGILGVILSACAWAFESGKPLPWLIASVSSVITGVLFLALEEVMHLLREIAGKRRS